MRRDARRARVSCDDAAPALLDIVDGATDVPDEIVGHVERCLRCQAEIVQHRKVARTLARTRNTHAEPPPDLLVGIVAALASAAAVDADQRDPWSALLHHRATHVAAAATAVSAGAAAGAFVLSRTRRTRLAPAG